MSAQNMVPSVLSLVSEASDPAAGAGNARLRIGPVRIAGPVAGRRGVCDLSARRCGACSADLADAVVAAVAAGFPSAGLQLAAAACSRTGEEC